MDSWRLLDHTADLCIEATGPTAPKALEALCAGLFAQLFEPGDIRGRSRVAIEVDGMDAAETLVAALGELLYWVTDKGWGFVSVKAVEVTPQRIRMEGLGEPRRSAEAPLLMEIKAATYHDLRIAPDEKEGIWRIRVVFDV